MIRWCSIFQEPIAVRGFYRAGATGFLRLPEAVLDEVGNPTLTQLAGDTAGGRVRFRTDSPTLYIRFVPQHKQLYGINMNILARSCPAVYINGVYAGGKPLDVEQEVLEWKGAKSDEMDDVEIYLPLYNAPLRMEIGIEADRSLLAPRPYPLDKTVLFYGSSITQGAAASQSGMSYVNQVGRALGCDYIDLGFSESAKGEQALATYIASLPIDAFVMDYDHNAPTREYLESTHEPFFQTIRRVRPKLPVLLLLSKPDFRPWRPTDQARMEVVRRTYEHAAAAGDRYVWFIPGESYFADHARMDCTADGVHPNDLGGYLMAWKIIPVLREMLAERGERIRCGNSLTY